MRLLSTLLAAVLATTAFSALAAEAKDPVEARKAIFKDYKKGVVSENGSQSTLSRFGAVEQFLSVRPKCTRWGDVPVQGLPRDAELLA